MSTTSSNVSNCNDTSTPASTSALVGSAVPEGDSSSTQLFSALGPPTKSLSNVMSNCPVSRKYTAVNGTGGSGGGGSAKGKCRVRDKPSYLVAHRWISDRN